MLIGSAVHGIDPKSRVFIPAKWRNDLGESIILTHGILGTDEITCLFGMSEQGWKEFATRFSTLPETDVMAQAFRRMMFANAAECELDKQGRILIPNALREYAKLDKEAVLVGMGGRIELWSPGAWEKHNTGISAEYQSALRRLLEMGI